MNLVVVESPSKAKTINKYLGKDYIVRASKGHIVDLPKSKLSIDVDHDFKPEYVVTNQKSLTELKKAFKDADKLVLAADLDREGEAIAWHVARELKVIDENGKHKGKKPVERIVFSEITKDAILDALEHPRDIDMNLVNSQQARRLLDRIVGYKLSPLLWKKIAFGLSAGRVQSVAVRLVVEKEEERNKFKKEEYWDILANLSKKKAKTVSIKYQKTNKEELPQDKENADQIDKDAIGFKLVKIDKKIPSIKDEKDAKKIVSHLDNKKWIIDDIVTSESKKYPRAPFITSTLQQAAVNRLGFSAKRAMMAAQKLYEQGIITYMRTDSTNMSNLAIEQARDYSTKNFGEKYIPAKPNVYSAKAKGAQEAHECIRPSNFFQTSNSLNLEGDMKKIYDLIWHRALSSQMVPALLATKSITINIDEYQFKVNGKTVLFDGYLRAYNEHLDEVILPDLQKGEELYPHAIIASQHFTQPPARYSEATLIKKLEELGIGRPSTYASIISTIIARKYVTNENKYLVPTDVGILVNKLLEKYFFGVVDYNFTANMEEDLDKVAEGKLNWVKMLKDFYFPFEKEVVKQDKNIPRSEFTELGKSDQKCPLCGSPMLIKLGRYGKFLSCSKYPTCKGMLSLDPENGGTGPVELDEKKFEPAPKTEDGREYVLKTSKFGKFWAHPDYPKVKESKQLLLKEKCPLCKHNLVERKGKWGSLFIGCSDYPNCKYIRNEKKKKPSTEEE